MFGSCWVFLVVVYSRNSHRLLGIVGRVVCTFQ